MTKKGLRGKQRESEKQEELIITKTLVITEVRAGQASNAPFCVILENGGDRDGTKDGDGKENVLIMDEPTAEHHGIPLTFATVGKELVCIFTCVPYTPSFSPRKNVLSVESLTREERVAPIYTTCPPAGRTKIRRVLTVKTPQMGVMYGSPLPCPLYRIAFAISEEEYRACKKALPRSTFEVHFQLQA